MKPELVARWVALSILGIAAWYLPWVAYGLAALILLLAPLLSFRAFKVRQFVALTGNLIALTITVASLYFDSRGMALIPMLGLASSFMPSAERALRIEYDAKMAGLRALGQQGRVDPTAKMLSAFEAEFKLRLPSEYREFIKRHGSTRVQAEVAFMEDTPLGASCTVESFFGFLDASVPETHRTDLTTATRVIAGRGITVPIATSPTGDWFCLVCSGKNKGRVLLRDASQRHLRRPNASSKPLSGIPGWYVVGESFADFIRRCSPASLTE